MPWGFREFVVKDCDGRLLCFGEENNSGEQDDPVDRSRVGRSFALAVYKILELKGSGTLKVKCIADILVENN